MTIIIADDDKLIRAGIKKIIQDNLEGEHEIIDAQNGEKAIELCRKIRPQVIITDIQMPGMTGVELMQQISQWEHRPSIIVLSGFNDFNYTKSALTSGAIDYILKPVDTNEIISALRRAMACVEKTEKDFKEKTLRKIIQDGHSEGITIEGDFFCVCVSVAESVREKHGRLPPESAEDFFTGITPLYILERRKNFFIALLEQNGIERMESDALFECCTVGVSEKCQNLSELRKISAQAYSALLEAFFADDNSGGKKVNGI
ncbi:MAG: response regulator [Treponemataceae bacterium]|nr:response regulator [Treponemataceae bacterium]